jgi:hypothetical protein
MTRNYFKVKTIDSLSLAGGSPSEGFCVEPGMKGPSFVYFFLILTNCNQMSQFNSIFSPLTNKLARLAGITLLAVAALFVGTQQMSAQTCVQNLTVNLGGQCTVTLTPAMVMVGTAPAGAVLKVNDNSPTDATVDAISPVTGWTYGVFDAAGALICSGTIVTTDNVGPTFSVAQKAAWELIDTVVTWADNLDEVQNVSASFWGNATGYQTKPSFGTGSRWYVGRPYMTDSCEYAGLAPGTLTRDSFWLIDADGNGRTVTGTAVPGVGYPSADSVGTNGALFHTSRNLQVKVTDYLETPQCDSLGFTNKLRRSWQFIDQRGNSTTLNQIIYFKRPDLRGSLANPFARTNASPSPTLDRGPGNLGQFGPFGTNPRRLAAPAYGEASSTAGITAISFAGLGGDKMVSGTSANSTFSNVYSAAGQTFRDTIAYELGTGSTCYNFDAATSMRDLLTCLYVAADTLPSGQVDSISLFSASLKSNYSVSFTHKEFPACNNGKKFEVITTVFDWCTGAQEFDTLIIKMEDKTAPIFAAHNANAFGGSIKGCGGQGAATAACADSVIISVGLNDCTASLRLPAKTGTRADLRDLSALFNWGVRDICTAGNNTDVNGIGVTLNYKIQSRNTWNNGFYVAAANYADANYTIATMSGGPVALGLPIGEHRICIEAWDGCNNQSFDTLYFDVQDMVAPTMKCDDQLNVSLTSNSTTNWYINGNGADVSNREVSDDQNARILVADINEGSRDNCTLDSMYVRRRIDWATCSKYLVWNMDYDIFGNNNGVVDESDFEAITGSTLRYTPKFMQYVEVMCCDGASGSQVMVELWGSDLVQGTLGNSNNNAPAGRNWSFCWGNIQIEDKTAPVITAPDLSKPYNSTATNWVECTSKEVIGTSSNTDGRIANEALSNQLFGYPDIYGLECKGSVVYSVTKALTCDTGTITRKWDVTKVIGDGNTTTVSATQVIYVRANHNFSITVPVDQSATCAAKNGTDLILDEAGCDLLAVSYSEVKYDAAPGDNFCYKIYRTGTVINWCMVPNHLSCAAADPAAYAVTIPRNTGAAAVKYTFTLSVADVTTRNKVGTGTGAALVASSAAANSTVGATVNVIGGAITTATPITTTSTGFVTVPTTTCYTKAGFAYKYTQVIKVTDNVKPDVASGTAWTPATADADKTAGISWNATKNSFSIAGKSTAANSCLAKVKLSFAASDACATNDLELENTELLKRGTDVAGTGTFVTKTAASTTNGLFTVELSGVPVGEYDLRVTVRDDCGNVTVSRLAVDVEDNKAPAPVCVQNLTATLMPAGDGTCMVVVKAIDVFQDINRDWNAEECSPSVVASIAKLTNGVEGTKAATLTLTGADKGGVTARVYLKDAAGNEDFCTVTINVEDNFCGNGTASAAVAGAIQTESKATVEGVQVNLSGQTQKSFSTSVNGLFVFNNLTAGADYTVTPSLNKGFLNGVSTFDLVLISKHILGVQPLNTPYKLIAADVNNSKSVTTLDLIQLRKLILNIDATFANNSSWRFVDASYTFPNASNPWAASFPEVKNVNDLVGSLSANFVAIKVGDVNGNAIANSTQGSVRNLTSNLGINVADMNLVAGNEYKVDFTAADLNGIEGFQFTLNLDKKGLELVDLVPGIAAEENFGIFAEEGVVTASWNGEAKGGVLFSLVVRAKSNTTLSEVLNLNSRYTAAEAYKGGEVVNVGLNFNASKASANYELYQNTPNPFAGESIIGFNLPAAGAATLTIQDVTGRTLKVINGQYAKGYNQVSLKSTELSATGVLTYTLKAADFTATRKMIIVE